MASCLYQKTHLVRGTTIIDTARCGEKLKKDQADKGVGGREIDSLPHHLSRNERRLCSEVTYICSNVTMYF